MKGHVLSVFTSDERKRIEAYTGPGISAGDAVRLIVLRALRDETAPARYARAGGKATDADVIAQDDKAP